MYYIFEIKRRIIIKYATILLTNYKKKKNAKMKFKK